MKLHLVSKEDPQFVSVIPPSVAEEIVDFDHLLLMLCQSIKKLHGHHDTNC